MNIKKIVVGPLDTNCYILERGNNFIIIDPGADADKIINNIDKSKKLLGIVITHSHDDHTGALNDLLSIYNTKVLNMHNMPEGRFALENFVFEVLYTPGHKDDAITLYFESEKIMFVGDFIFKGGIGRTDLAGASPFDMNESINRILKYPKDITLYPGHYESTTLGDEEKYLKYFANII